MLKIKDFSKVLIEYKRTPDRLTSYVGKDEEGRPIAKLQHVRGKIRGIVVAIDRNIIGWSLCDKKDKFDLEYGLSLALRRAQIAKGLPPRNRARFYQTIPTTMLPLFNSMDDRSERYFTEN